MKLLCVLFLLFPAASPASDWTKADTAREATYLALHVADWGQTRDIANNPGYWETNPILGEHPSIRRVDTYFVFTGILHVGVAYLLPSRWREAFQLTTTGIEAAFVYSNNSIGLKVHFK